MNSGFVQGLAAELAKAVEGTPAPAEKIKALYRRVFARDANPDEVALGIQYLEAANVARYAQALLATNEIIFWP